MDFLELLDRIDFSQKILRKKALESVNQLLVMRNWLIGHYIVKYEQKGADRASYGEKLISRLSAELGKKQIKGMSETNLKLSRSLYLIYPQIGQPVADLLSGSPLSIGQPLADESFLTRDFSHADVGQMNFYLNYFKENIMQAGDNSPVGIILCTQKDIEKVKYATAGLDQKLFVSKYLIQLPSEEELLKLIKERF